EAGNVAALQRASAEGKPADWTKQAEATFHRNRFKFGITAFGFLTLTLLYLRRSHRDEEALFAGLTFLFVLTHPSHYEFMILSLVPLMFPDDRRMWTVLGIALALVGAVRFLPTSSVMDSC